MVQNTRPLGKKQDIVLSISFENDVSNVGLWHFSNTGKKEGVKLPPSSMEEYDKESLFSSLFGGWLVSKKENNDTWLFASIDW